MTTKDNGGNDPSLPDGAGDGMDLLIDWRAGGTEAAGTPAAERNAGEAAESGAEAVSVPALDPAAATMADLAAGQRRILALLEDLAPKQAEAPAGEAGTDLQEAATAIQAATEWVSDIRAAIDAVLAYRREMAALTKRLDEGETLAARVEQSIGPWTERIETSLDEGAKAQKRAAAETSGNVQQLTQGGDAFLEKFGTAYSEALEGFRAEWRRTRRWSVPVMAAVLVLMLPTLPVMGALGQSLRTL